MPAASKCSAEFYPKKGTVPTATSSDPHETVGDIGYLLHVKNWSCFHRLTCAGRRHARHLYAVGASDAVPETIEASLQLSEAALIGLGIAIAT
jgi:hypothetical protein